MPHYGAAGTYIIYRGGAPGATGDTNTMDKTFAIGDVRRFVQLWCGISRATFYNRIRPRLTVQAGRVSLRNVLDVVADCTR